MPKGTRGTVVSVRPELQQERLKVVATVKTPAGETLQAQMPDREISAILPRSVLLGQACTAPPALMETLRPILSRMTEGRDVRLWQYRERWFFSFRQWKSVRFVEEPSGSPGKNATPA